MRITIIVFFLLLYVVSGCKDDCYPFQEPELKILFYDNNKEVFPRFKRVYGVGSSQNLSPKDNYYRLPISLNSDSVSYLFENANRTDTLTLFYKRNFYFDSERCGYVTEIAQTTVPYTSFTTVLSLIFTEQPALFSRRQNIYEISIQL